MQNEISDYDPMDGPCIKPLRISSGNFDFGQARGRIKSATGRSKLNSIDSFKEGDSKSTITKKRKNRINSDTRQYDIKLEPQTDDFKEFGDFRRNIQEVEATVVAENLRPISTDRDMPMLRKVQSPETEYEIESDNVESEEQEEPISPINEEDRGKVLLYDHSNFTKNEVMLSRNNS